MGAERQMIRKSVKNYFINLKYIFTPLGVLALAAVIGLSISVPGAISAVRELTDKVVELTNSVELDLAAFGNSIWHAGTALDWNKPSTALDAMLSEQWLTTAFSDAIHALVPNGEQFAEQIAEAVTQAVASVLVNVIVLAVWLIIGAIAGFLITKMLVRREIAKRAFWKYFLVAFVDAIITVAATMLILWLTLLWTPSIAISLLLGFLLCGIVSLFEAYLVHGYKKVACKDIVNIKNVAKLWLADLIIFIIACALIALDFVIFNAVVGSFIAVPIIEITVIVISLNAEAYVKDAADVCDAPTSARSDVYEQTEPTAQYGSAAIDTAAAADAAPDGGV